MKKIIFSNDFIEITLREVIASLAIIFTMIAFGFFIHSNIHDGVMERNERYEKAPVVSSLELYDYVKKTGVGEVFSYFELEAAQPQKIEELNGEYLAIKKIKEHHTRHTRTVTTTDSKGKTHTKVEVYYSWDRVNTETFESSEVIFNKDIYPANKFEGYDYYTANLSEIGTEYLKENYYKINHQYAYEDSNDRYYFYVAPKEMSGSVFVNLKDDEIKDNYVSLYSDMSPEELKDRQIEDPIFSLVLFWFFWIILTIGLVIVFYVIDNRWLES